MVLQNMKYDNTVFSVSFIEDLKTEYMQMWWATDCELPVLGEPVYIKDKIAREKALSKFMEKTVSGLEKLPESTDLRQAWFEQVKSEAREIGRFSFGLDTNYMDLIASYGFPQVTREFMKKARMFDPGIKLEDTMQAMRNVWIMNSIQILLNQKVQYSPSIFAYSMLYPYTDNYLDDPMIPDRDKKDINHRFGKRLSGEKLMPANRYEASLFELVQMIEGQYPRLRYPEVYDSLLGIHHAQEKSLFQQRGSISPYENDILGISFEKGGASVLADAYLVKGTLSRKEAEFMFGFGIILQLSDDLQDVERDLKNGHMTLFSQTARNWKLDAVTSRLFRFVHHVLDSGRYFSEPPMQELKKMMKYNLIFLMFEAIAQNHKYFSKDFLAQVEAFSPFRFQYLRKLYEKVKKEYVSLKRGKRKDIDSVFESLLNE